MNEATLAENLIEYIIVQSKDKQPDEIIGLMQEILGQLKENKFELLKREMGML